jgi:hypothetical protein
MGIDKLVFVFGFFELYFYCSWHCRLSTESSKTTNRECILKVHFKSLLLLRLLPVQNTMSLSRKIFQVGQWTDRLRLLPVVVGVSRCDRPIASAASPPLPPRG